MCQHVNSTSSPTVISQWADRMTSQVINTSSSSWEGHAWAFQSQQKWRSPKKKKKTLSQSQATTVAKNKVAGPPPPPFGCKLWLAAQFYFPLVISLLCTMAATCKQNLAPLYCNCTAVCKAHEAQTATISFLMLLTHTLIQLPGRLDSSCAES